MRSDERIMLLFSLMNSLMSSSSSTASADGGSDGGQTCVDPCNLPGGDLSSSPSGPSNNSSGSSGLLARTYTVIPMTSKVGLLEWVPNTTPLRSIILTEMSACPVFLANTKNKRDNRGQIIFGQIDAWNEMSKMHCCFNTAKSADYHEMFVKVSKEKAEKVYRAAQNVLPDDFLRRHLLKLSSGFDVALLLITSNDYIKLSEPM